MLLTKLILELSNLVEKFQSVLTIWAKCRVNFHEVECTPMLLSKTTNTSSRPPKKENKSSVSLFN